MRITNNIIMGNTKSNVNANKINVNTLNNQMSSQKKIDKPSEDPVVAVRALRLRSSMSELNHYLKTNCSEAASWMEITETALTNIRKLLKDAHTQCNSGATGTPNADDRNTILSSLQQIREQIYSEGNADYAGRTVLTGYKTNSTLTYLNDSTEQYTIKQDLSFSDIKENTYIYNEVTTDDIANLNGAAVSAAEPGSQTLSRIRLAYDDLDTITAAPSNFSLTKNDGSAITYTAADGSTQNLAVTNTTTEALEASDYAVGDYDTLFNSDTGELIFGKEIANQLKEGQVSMQVTYNKTGFEAGDLRPENYFNCTNNTTGNTFTHYDDDGKWISEDINYTVATNQTMAINIEANDVLNTNIGRDIDELTNSVQAAIDAHAKVDKLTAMQSQDAYADEESQAKIAALLEAANKEATLADNKMQSLYSSSIGTFQGYLTTVDLAITDIGARGDRLDLTKNRVSSQYSTVEKLKSDNEDKDLSDIVIDYTASYLAYQASLQAAAKVQEQTLLDYI